MPSVVCRERDVGRQYALFSRRHCSFQGLYGSQVEKAAFWCTAVGAAVVVVLMVLVIAVVVVMVVVVVAVDV